MDSSPYPPISLRHTSVVWVGRVALGSRIKYERFVVVGQGKQLQVAVLIARPYITRTSDNDRRCGRGLHENLLLTLLQFNVTYFLPAI